jgi:hypothetical protein
VRFGVASVRPWLLWARAWGLWPLTAAGAVSLSFATITRGHPLAVPGRPGLQVELWPFSPVFFALAVGMAAGVARRDHERGSVRARSLRAWAVFGYQVVGFLSIAGATWLQPGVDPLLLARNCCFAMGLALMSAAVTGPMRSWVPLTVASLGTCLFGAHPGGPSSWAVILAPRASGLPALISVALVTAGSVTYVAAIRGCPGWSAGRIRDSVTRHVSGHGRPAGASEPVRPRHRAPAGSPRWRGPRQRRRRQPMWS